MTAIAIGPRRETFLTPHTDRAWSETGRALMKDFAEASDWLMSTWTFREPHEAAFSALLSAASEASEPGWDGYRAKPVVRATLQEAARFLHALPTSTPVPDITPEPDGEIDFEWYVSPICQFSVSVRKDGRLAWAAVDGGSVQHGRTYFLDELPEAIGEQLARTSRARARSVASAAA